MDGPLEGIRIIDLTNWLHGPLAATMLAEMGADVIKVEGLPAGDPARGQATIGSYPPSDIHVHTELSLRSKRSIGINLRSEEGRSLVRDLTRDADVFVSNIRERALREWGFDYASLSGPNPRLIWAHASSYGPRGPDSALPATDLAAQARGGLLNLMAERDSHLSPYGAFAMADTVGALQLAYAVVLALYARTHTGRGQEVRTSLLGGQVIAGAMALQAILITEQEVERPCRRSMPNPLRNLYRTRDNRWIALSMAPESYWPRFCQALGLDNLVADPRYVDVEARKANCESLIQALDALLAEKTLAELLAIAREHDLQFAPVNTHRDVARDPQIWENGYAVVVDHPVHGPVKEVGITVELGDTPGRVKSAAPQMGQHTEEVLLERGYNWEQIQQLKAAGAVV